jgi:hypothetical protein
MKLQPVITLILPSITLLVSTAHAQRAGGPYMIEDEVTSGPQTRQVAGDTTHAVSGVSTPGQSAATAGPYVLHSSGSARRAVVLESGLTPATAPLPEDQSTALMMSFTTDRRGAHAIPAANLSLAATSGPVAVGPSPGHITAGIVHADTPATAEGSFDILHAIASFTVLDSAKDNFGAYAGDGLDDDWQVLHFGEDNPLAGPALDPDGDSQNNLFEFTAGLDPKDPASRFLLRIEAVSGQSTHKSLVFSPLVPGRSYAVQYRTILTSGTWLTLGGTTTNDNGAERTVIDQNAVESGKFYRVGIMKP